MCALLSVGEAGAWCSGFRMLVEVDGHRFGHGVADRRWTVLGAGSTAPRRSPPRCEKIDAMGALGIKRKHKSSLRKQDEKSVEERRKSVRNTQVDTQAFAV